MKKINTIYTISAFFLTLTSCVQEGLGGDETIGESTRIFFRSHFPFVTETRAGVISQNNLPECRVTSINPDDTYLIDPSTEEIAEYFSDIRIVKDSEGRFHPEDETTGTWPDRKSRLHFFAYYPSVESMRETVDASKFQLVNKTKKTGGTANFDYRLEKFKVASDISRQVDFIAAYSNGTMQENSRSGINLNFTHQLAQIEISAWGANEKYDFEIAGVRIGNPITEGDFCFSSQIPASSSNAAWINTSGQNSKVENIFSKEDNVIILSKSGGSHAEKENAASIMGNAGPAMVIPMAEKIEAWEGNADPATSAPDYKTGKMYFSVLLRVKNKENEIVYPYPNDTDNIPVTYLTIGNDGKVSGRVYKYDGEYYTDNEQKVKYHPNETEEIRGFCWAALPVGAKWEGGKIYTYKLNFSSGIGWQDPSDPNPGDPIIERGKIPFEVEVEEWLPAEGHNSNLDVPKR